MSKKDEDAGWAREFDDDDFETGVRNDGDDDAGGDVAGKRKAAAAAAAKSAIADREAQLEREAKARAASRSSLLQAAVAKVAQIATSPAAQKRAGTDSQSKTMLFDAMTTLQAELDFASRETLNSVNPKLDSNFFELLAAKCNALMLRELLSSICVKVSQCDGRSMGSIFVSLLQLVANAKNNDDDLHARLASMHVVGILAQTGGRQFSNSFSDVVSAMLRQLNKADEPQAREMALQTLRRALPGAGNARSRDWSDVMKMVKLAVGDDFACVRIAGAECLVTVCTYSPDDFIEFDTFLPYCLKGISEPDANVRLAFARALGLMLFEIAIRQQRDTEAPAAQSSGSGNGSGKPEEKESSGFSFFGNSNESFGPRRKDGKPRAKRSYEIFNFKGALTLLSGLFQKAASATSRGALSFSTLMLLRRAVGLNLMTESLLSETLPLLFGFLAQKAVGSDRDAGQSERCIESIIRDALLGETMSSDPQGGLGILPATGSISAFQSGPAGNSGALGQSKQLDELTQQSLANHLVKILAEYQKSGIAVVNLCQLRVALRLLCVALYRLGPSVDAIKGAILDPLLALLSHPAPSVRVHTARCLRQFVRALPAQATSMLHSLHAIFKSGASEAMAPPDATVNDLSTILQQVHGYGLAMVGLVNLVPELPCGVPHRLLEELFDTSSSLLLPSSSGGWLDEEEVAPLARRILQSVAWTLIAALVSLGTPWLSSRLKNLLGLWKEFLVRRNKDCKPANANEWVDELQSRSGALLALKSFTLVFQDKLPHQPHLLKPTAMFTLHVLAFFKQFEDATSGVASATSPTVTATSEMNDEMAWLRAMLFQVMATLPSSSLSSRFVAIVHSAVQQFTHRSSEPASFMQYLLSKDDRALAEPGFGSASWLFLQTAVHNALNSTSSSSSSSSSFLSSSNGPVTPFTAAAVSPSSHQLDILALLSHDSISAPATFSPRIEYLWTLPLSVGGSAMLTFGQLSHHHTQHHSHRHHGHRKQHHHHHSLNRGSVLLSPSAPTSSPQLLSPSSSTMSASSTLTASSSVDGLPEVAQNAGVAAVLSSASMSDELGDLYHPFGAHLSPAQISVNSSLKLFATIFADQNSTHKKQLLDHFLVIVKKAVNALVGDGSTSSSSLQANARAHALNQAIVWNIAAALLAIGRDMVARLNEQHQSSGESPAEVSLGNIETMDVVLTIVAELVGWAQPEVRRAIAEACGVFARLESAAVSAGNIGGASVNTEDPFTQRALSMLRSKFESKDASVLCGASLIAACLHRYLGGLRANSFLAFTMANLHNLGRNTDDTIRVWTLHSLASVVEVGGLSFSAFVRPTLALACAQSLVDFGAKRSTPAVSAALCRLVTALCAMLGPELMEPASADVRARCLVLQKHATEGVSAMDSLSVLEGLLCVEQLSVWAPDTLSMNALWPLLLRGLRSDCVAARRAALRCLHQRVEKQPSYVVSLGLDVLLFECADAETDPDTHRQIADSLAAFVQCTFQSHPVRWLSLAKYVLMGASGNGGRVPALLCTGLELPTSLSIGHGINDNQDECLISAQDLVAAGDDDGSQGNKPFTGSPTRTFRFDTRVLAIDCLRSILELLRKSKSSDFEASPPHLDPLRAKKLSQQGQNQQNVSPSTAVLPLQPGHGGFLANSLFELLTVVCRAADGSWAAMKISGLRALRALLLCFAGLVDPESSSNSRSGRMDDDDDDDGNGDDEESEILLLSQYQVQLSAVLKSAFATEELAFDPQLRAAACQVVVSLLGSGVALGNTVAEAISASSPLRRLLDLVRQSLVSPQHIKSEAQAWLNPIFATAAHTSIRSAHLTTLAQLQAMSLGRAHLLPTAVARSSLTSQSIVKFVSSSPVDNSGASIASALILLQSRPDSRFAGLAELMNQSSPQLIPLYLQACADWAVLASQPRRVAAAYTGGNMFLGIDAAVVKPMLLHALPLWLVALYSIFSATNSASLKKQVPWLFDKSLQLPAEVSAALPPALAAVLFLLQSVQANLTAAGSAAANLAIAEDEREQRVALQGISELDADFQSSSIAGPEFQSSGSNLSVSSSICSSALRRTLIAALGFCALLMQVPYVDPSSNEEPSSSSPLSMAIALEVCNTAASLLQIDGMPVDVCLSALNVVDKYLNLVASSSLASSSNEDDSKSGQWMLPLIEAVSAPIRHCVRAIHPDFQNPSDENTEMSFSTSVATPMLLEQSSQLLSRLLKLFPASQRPPLLARLMLHSVFVLRFGNEGLVQSTLNKLGSLFDLLLECKDEDASHKLLTSTFSSIASHLITLAASASTEHIVNIAGLLRSALLIACKHREISQSNVVDAQIDLFGDCIQLFQVSLRSATSSSPRAAACQTILSLVSLQQQVSITIPNSDFAKLLLAVVPSVASVLRRPLDAIDALDALKASVFLLSSLSNPSMPGGSELIASQSDAVDLQLSLWVPLILTRLFPAGAVNNNSDVQVKSVATWQATHDFAVQLLLKLVATYGDAFREVVNNKLPQELRSRLEKAVAEMREKQLQQQQREAAAAAAKKNASKKKKGGR